MEVKEKSDQPSSWLFKRCNCDLQSWKFSDYSSCGEEWKYEFYPKLQHPDMKHP